MPQRSVHKFGGAALADGPAIERVVALVRELWRTGASTEAPVVVVSAHLGVTALLEELAHEAARGSVSTSRLRLRQRSILAQLGLDPERLDHWLTELARLLEAIAARGALLPLERDLALSYGERMSARVVAAALSRAGVVATPVDAYDLGLTSDSNHGRARPVPGMERAIRAALDEVPGVPVVTGFLARDERGNLTTLGRNGSDLSAALVAEAVGARELVFWKTVGGVMSADPRLVPGARTLRTLAFDEAAELTFHGAEVLHPAALAPARRPALEVSVRDVQAPDDPGTRLVERPARVGPVALGCRREIVLARLELAAPELRAPVLERLLEVLEARRIDAGLVSARGGRLAIVLPAAADLAGLQDELGPARGATLALEPGLAQLGVVGLELGSRPFEALEAAGVEVALAFVDQRAASQAFLVPSSALERAARALHSALLEPTGDPGDALGETSPAARSVRA